MMNIRIIPNEEVKALQDTRIEGFPEYGLIPYLGEGFITLNWNNLIVPRYYISNFGRIFDCENTRLLNYSQDKDGYFLTSISVNDSRKTIRVHRIELMSFFPIKNPESFEVNHKDGNKQNLYLNNLEWATDQDNTRHGWKMGLNLNRGQQNGNGVYSDELIHYICSCLASGMRQNEICNELGIFEKEERMRMSATISGIKYGKTHRDISVQYGLLCERQQYSLEFANLVCKFLSDETRDFTYKEIMDFLNIEREHRIGFKVYINDLIKGRTALEVTKEYSNLKKPLEGRNGDNSLW